VTTWAQREQGHSNGHDAELLAVARSRNGRVRWWWGRRRWTQMDTNVYYVGDKGDYFTGLTESTRHHGAWCYICNLPIATWSSKYPMTEAARAAVQNHRTDHIQGRLDTATQEHER